MTDLRKALRQYVKVRRELGAKMREPAVTLDHFVNYLRQEGAAFVTTELAVRWVLMRENVQPATRSRLLSMIRKFAAWLSAFDSRTEVPPRHILAARHRRPKPYIYADEEVGRLMEQAARLPSCLGLRALTYSTLIGLLAATGLRPGEALALDTADVDLDTGVLAVRETKFGKSRFVPLHDSASRALAEYAASRDRLCPQRLAGAFFVSEGGKRLVGNTVRRTFARLASSIGLRKLPGARRIGGGPRVQDLRHSFATRRLVEWYRAGSDVRREMPKLTTYLGHATAASTYWYIEAVPELLGLATERLDGGVS
jgi:site-specific recombinase XerD